MFWNAVLVSAASIFGIMTFFFLISILMKDNSVADIAYGLAFMLVAVFTLFRYGDFHFRQILVTALVVVWGLRLSGYILYRNLGKEEDWRYAEMKEGWLYVYARSFFQVFMFQGLLILIVSLPVILINWGSGPGLNWLDMLALGVWIFGFIFEVVADYQKYMYKKDNEGFVRGGLWEYSRHPNYFGEVTMWFGIWLLSLSVPYGWAAVVSPLILGFSIIKVTGVPILEERYGEREGWDEYVENTNKFFPSFKK